MKTYIHPIARVIALYDEAELLGTSETFQKNSDPTLQSDFDESDKSNRRSVWDSDI